MSNIAYIYKNNLYLNITNRCTSKCIYCIRYKWKWKFRSYNLKLDKDPTSEEIIKEINNSIKKNKNIKEIVFCGYGEPTLRLEIIKEISAIYKEKNYSIRINTNGHGNLIHNKNILPDLKNLIDTVSVSLNGCDSRTYFKLNRPLFGLKTFSKVIEFIKEAKKYIKNVIVTTIKLPGMDTSKCSQIANNLGVNFILRDFLDEYEEN